MIEFYKLSGSGNDFILIDNRNRSLAIGNMIDFVKAVCRRRISVGADGLILIEPSDKVDFKWRFFNADGSEVDMCGNGGRCAARFAFIKGIAKNRLSFETGAGIIDAEVSGDIVKLRLTDPHSLATGYQIAVDGRPFNVSSINTGVPHVVHMTDDLESMDVLQMGRKIRYHEHYKPAGTNADFVKIIDGRTLGVRTYERGVEDETLACGTGAVASALIAASMGLVESPVDVQVRSGETLKIHFSRTNQGFEKIYLEGKVKVVYQGALWEEAYR